MIQRPLKSCQCSVPVSRAQEDNLPCHSLRCQIRVCEFLVRQMTLSYDSINFSFALINSRLVACNGPVSKRGSIWMNWGKEVGIQTPGEDLENLSRSFRDQAIPELIQSLLRWLARFDVLGRAICGFHRRKFFVGIVDMDAHVNVSEIEPRQLTGFYFKFILLSPAAVGKGKRLLPANCGCPSGPILLSRQTGISRAEINSSQWSNNKATAHSTTRQK
jgi:hypothetical protein